MKVKATNPMAKAIRDALTGCRVTLEKMDPDAYRVNVDYDLFRNETDYSITTGKLSVIRVEYPPEYYSTPRYITTRDLVRTYRNSDGSFQGFTAAIKSEYAI